MEVVGNRTTPNWIELKVPINRSREEEQLCLRQLVRTSKRRAGNKHFSLSERPFHFSKSALRADITAHCLRQPRAMKRQPHAVYIGMRRTAVASSSCVQNALRCAPWARAQQQRTRSASSMGQHQQARQGSIALCQQQGCRVGVKLLSTLMYSGCFLGGWSPNFFSRGSAPHPAGAPAPDPEPKSATLAVSMIPVSPDRESPPQGRTTAAEMAAWWCL